MSRAVQIEREWKRMPHRGAGRHARDPVTFSVRMMAAWRPRRKRGGRGVEGRDAGGAHVVDDGLRALRRPGSSEGRWVVLAPAQAPSPTPKDSTTAFTTGRVRRRAGGTATVSSSPSGPVSLARAGAQDTISAPLR